MDNNNKFFPFNSFTLGFAAGAASYFLFGTDKGRELRDQVGKEWQKARKDLEAEGYLPKDQSLIEAIVSPRVVKTVDSIKNKHQRAKTKTVAKKKFKGT